MERLRKEFDARAIQRDAVEQMAGIDLRAEIAASPGPGGGPRRASAFIEGPPTMNGAPHAGHLRGRVIKDLWYRYATLRGGMVAFNAGWDTQGLPVELQAQKELGTEGGGREAAGSAGAGRLAARCKALVERYSEKWIAVDRALGVSLDHSGAYWTHRDGYIEREWQFLKKALRDGILEDDHTVIAYCPSCQTSLSHAEVNQRYEEVSDPSLYYKVRLAGSGEYLVVWTTMPFTLVTDAMVALNPDEDYNYVEVGGEVWVVGASRMEAMLGEIGIKEYGVAKTVKGSELEGARYEHPLYEEVPRLRELAEGGGYHVAVAEGFVDAGAGSGIVHLSPANGEEDIAVAKRRGLRAFCPIDDGARFTAEAGRYAGSYVRDADSAVVEDLRSRGALVKAGRLRHKYPLCWRSGHRVVWLARRGWFYKLDRLGDRAVRAAEAARYFFEQPRNRFLGIVREKHPWCISRERSWGCPMPVWNCGECGNRDWLFSRGEIVKAAAELPDGPGFELHSPWIDRVTVRCSACGGTDTRREKYVLDTWHNSGAAPFASMTDEGYAASVPAPFLTEGIDQTRGWAYTLLIQNVILGGGAGAPFASFLFQGHVLDADGGKMSKSQGNVIDAAALLEEHPADLVRLYFVRKSSPIEPLSFSAGEISSRPYQVLSTLYHMHLYYAQNSAYDRFDPGEHTVEWAGREGLLSHPDRWVLSRLQRLARGAAEANDSCRFHEAARAVEEFVVGAVSQTYVPAVRRELWDEGGGGGGEGAGRRRLAIYAVLRRVLLAADVMMHPACPHTTEYLYRRALGGPRRSIMLEGWPEADPALEDEGVERSFEALGEAASACAAARMKAGLKRRWPLDGAIVCVAEGGAAGGGAGPAAPGPVTAAALESLPGGLLDSHLNVEKHEVRRLAGAGGWDGPGAAAEMLRMGLPVEPRAALDRKKAGPKAGRMMPGLLAALDEMGPAEAARRLLALPEGAPLEVDAGGGGTVSLSAGDFGISVEAAAGHAAAARGNVMVIVPTSRSRELTARGLVRDVARRIQALRKEGGHEPTAVLEGAAVLGLEGEDAEMLGERRDELAFLVRVKRVSLSPSGFPGASYKDEEIDGRAIRIAVVA